MVQIISGKKGKGKTPNLLEKANNAVKTSEGSIVYLDKSTKHMYELSNKIRLINVLDYGIDNHDKFIGFISGIIAQDHDIEQVYLDSFLKLSCQEGEDITTTVQFLDKIGSDNQVTFVLSVSADEHELPEAVKKYIEVSL